MSTIELDQGIHFKGKNKVVITKSVSQDNFIKLKTLIFEEGM